MDPSQAATSLAAWFSRLSPDFSGELLELVFGFDGIEQMKQASFVVLREVADLSDAIDERARSGREGPSRSVVEEQEIDGDVEGGGDFDDDLDGGDDAVVFVAADLAAVDFGCGCELVLRPVALFSEVFDAVSE